jgi:hypothetical protein
MTGEPGATRAPRPLADEGARGQDVFGLGERERDALLAWVGENLTLVRRSASGQRILYWSLGITFAVGLAAHVGGFLLKSSATTKPLLLVADLLYALGGVLWTGVVLVMFIQIYPEAQKRQYKRALDAYEATVGAQARAGSGQVPDPASAREAVAMYRELAQADPDRYRPRPRRIARSSGRFPGSARSRRRRIGGPVRDGRPHWRATRYRICRPADPVTLISRADSLQVLQVVSGQPSA